MSESRDKTINLRVSEIEKSEIEKRAKSVGTDVSTLIRNAVLSDKKLVLLHDGTEIAKGVCSLVREIHTAERNGSIDKKYCTTILSSLEELVSAFNQVSDKLSDISDDSEYSQKEGEKT